MNVGFGTLSLIGVFISVGLTACGADSIRAANPGSQPKDPSGLGNPVSTTSICKLATPIDLGTDDPSDGKNPASLIDAVLDQTIRSAEIPKEKQSKDLVVGLGMESWYPGDHYVSPTLQIGRAYITDEKIVFDEPSLKRSEVVVQTTQNGEIREFSTRIERAYPQGLSVHALKMQMRGTHLISLQITFPVRELADPSVSAAASWRYRFTGKNQTVCLTSAKLAK